MKEGDDDYIKQREKAFGEASKTWQKSTLFRLGFQQGFSRGFRFGVATKFYCKRCGIFITDGGLDYCKKCTDIILNEIDNEFGKKVDSNEKENNG